MRTTLLRISLLTSALLVGFTAYLHLQPAKPARTPLFQMPRVMAQNGCSPATIAGNYGFGTEGTVSVLGGKMEIAQLGNMEFKEGGTLTGSYTVSVRGIPNVTGDFTGTYQVAADCTGSATIDAGGEKSLVNFVVGNKGNTLSTASTGVAMGGLASFTMSGLAGRTTPQ